MSPVTAAAILFVCLATEAFFSGSEIALVSANRIRLKRLADEGRRGPGLALLFLERPQWLFGTTLVGTNVSTITAAITVTLFLLGAGLEHHSEWLAVLCTVPLTLVIAEFLPKSLFQHFSDRLAPIVVYPLLVASLLFAPVVGLAVLASGGIARLVGGRREDGARFLNRDELMLLARQHHEAGALPDETRMIRRLIEFPRLTCRHVAKPLVQVALMRRNWSVGRALPIVAEKGYSRYPVWGQRLDDVQGIVHSFDLLGAPLEAPLSDYVRPATFVPQSMRAERLLAEMQRTGQSMAIMVNEYGGADGIVTMEDLLEEIVGEIEDEHDALQQPYMVQGTDSYLISGRAEIAMLNEDLKLDLPAGHYQTIAGLMLERMGKIPRAGESMRLGDLTLTVRKAERQAILQVQVVRSEPKA